jgi:hypothetical protein
MSAAALLAGCVQAPPPYRESAAQDGGIVPAEPRYVYGAPQSDYQDPGGAGYGDGYSDGAAPQDEAPVEVYIDPPLDQPPPVRVEWAPPPLLDEPVPPPPYPDAIWTGGYWAWQDNWVWARGRWLAPPRPNYRWVRPYYEHRGNSVIFINGFWAAPGVGFRRPPPTLNIPYAHVRPGVRRGPRPSGPEGSFVPPPHGARRGSFVPAPLPEPQAVRPPERRPPQSATPGTRDPRPAPAPGRASPDRPYEPGTQMRPGASPQDRSPDRGPDQDRGQDRNRDRNQGQDQGRDPGRDQNRDFNRGVNRGPDRDQARPPGMTPPPVPTPQVMPTQPDRSERAGPENGSRRSSMPNPNAAGRPPAQRPQADRHPDRNPAMRPPQVQHAPRPQPQPQAAPRPQPAPQARPPVQRPAPQARPEHRAPPPRANPPAEAAPVQPEGRGRGNREH